MARICMQIFDIKWKAKLADMEIITWLLTRYMDDSRAFLPPIKKGWRLDTSGLKYCKAWEKADMSLTTTEVTKRVVLESMGGIEDFLEFTVETAEDEGFGGWLPTLDTSLQVDMKTNTINYKYFEKTTCSKKTVQEKTAMNTNTKNQILSN